MILPEDYQNEVLNAMMANRRRYQMITNSDGTVSFIDRTVYNVEGSIFNADDINNITTQVNQNTVDIENIGRQVSRGNVTGVKGIDEDEYRAGDVELSASNVGAYSKEEVNQLISAVQGLSIKNVAALPTQDISPNTIYLTPSVSPTTTNQKDEWIYIFSYTFTNRVDDCALYENIELLPAIGQENIYYLVLDELQVYIYDVITENYIPTDEYTISVLENMPSMGVPNVFYVITSSDNTVFSCTVGGSWENFGTTDIDLTNYYTKSQVNTLIDAIPQVTVDSELDSESSNPVENRVIYESLNDKQNVLNFDTVPTINSENPVTSDGLYSALRRKASVTDLEDYYTKSQIDDMLDGYTPTPSPSPVIDDSALNYEIVDSLPTTNISYSTIYITPSSNPITRNTKEEFLYLPILDYSNITSDSEIAESVGDFSKPGLESHYYIQVDSFSETVLYKWNEEIYGYEIDNSKRVSIVDALPSTGVKDTIYLVRNNNSYEVYLYQIVGGNWEKIGGASSGGSSDSYSKDEIDDLLSYKMDIADRNSLALITVSEFEAF